MQTTGFQIPVGYTDMQICMQKPKGENVTIRERKRMGTHRDNEILMGFRTNAWRNIVTEYKEQGIRRKVKTKAFQSSTDF